MSSAEDATGDDAATDERRSDRRRRITLQVEYPDRQGYRVDWIESASPGGLFLRTDDRHRVGDTLRLALTLPGFSESIEVTGTVAWLRHQRGDSPAGVGVRIAEDEFLDEITRLLPAASSREFSLVDGPYARLAALPRVRLATTPTPLQRAERLSRVLGGPDIWIKRDDLTGFGLGGSEVRKLELIAADALQRGADTLVTGAASITSNHLRMTSAVARYLGMQPVIVVPGAEAAAIPLDLAMLDVQLVESPGGTGADLDAQIAAAATELEERGLRPYPVAVGGASPLGSCGYMLASIELGAQLRRLSLEPDVVVLAHCYAGTHAGLFVGQRWLDASYDVLGVSVGRPSGDAAQKVALLAAEVEQMLAIDDTLPVDDIWIEDDCAGGGFGHSTDEALAAVKLMAQHEGVFLDPLDTGKAMAALIALIRRGELVKGQTVIFWNTSGWPASFS